MRLAAGNGTYLIHGTNNPIAVGLAVTHGCIRMYPDDVAALFPLIAVGTPVRLINEPIKVAWVDGELLLEAHPPVDAQGQSFEPDIDQFAEMLRAAVGDTTVAIHWDYAREVLQKADGVIATVALAADDPNAPAPAAPESAPAADPGIGFRAGSCGRAVRRVAGGSAGRGCSARTARQPLGTAARISVYIHRVGIADDGVGMPAFRRSRVGAGCRPRKIGSAGCVPHQRDRYRGEPIDALISQDGARGIGGPVVNGDHDVLRAVVGNLDLDALTKDRARIQQRQAAHEQHSFAGATHFSFLSKNPPGGLHQR